MPRLKSWESPRREGRNDKGKGGSARKRQLKKKIQALRKKLSNNLKVNQGGETKSPPFFLLLPSLFLKNSLQLK
jgi:hypothetical protein